MSDRACLYSLAGARGKHNHRSTGLDVDTLGMLFRAMRIGLGHDPSGTAIIMVLAAAGSDNQARDDTEASFDRMQCGHCARAIRIKNDQTVANDAAEFMIGMLRPMSSNAGMT